MAGIGSSSKATLAALATVALWASAFPFIRIVLRSFDPIPLAAMRFFVAAIVVAGWLLWHRPRLPSFADILRLMLCAAIGIAAYNILLNSGQRTVSAGAASFIVNIVPVITALIALVFLGERFGLGAWIGTAVSFAGITVIAGGLPGGFLRSLTAAPSQPPLVRGGARTLTFMRLRWTGPLLAIRPYTPALR